MLPSVNNSSLLKNHPNQPLTTKNKRSRLNNSFNFAGSPSASKLNDSNVSFMPAADIKKNLMISKRLNYLRSTIDELNPTLTRLSSIEKAEDTRSKRIYELWKHDQDVPTVKETLEYIRNMPGGDKTGTSKLEFEKII